MHEYTIASTFKWGGATCSTDALVRVPDSEDPQLPVIVLVHGTGGNSKDMSDPGNRVGFNYDLQHSVESEQDHGWNTYPGVGPRKVEIDTMIDPVILGNWQDALNQAGFRTVNYSQIAGSARLPQDIEQLKALLEELLRHPSLRGRYFTLLGHSRGGILARAGVVAAHEQFDVSRIKQLITLHSPNQGSGLANVADAVASIDRIMSSVLRPLLPMGGGSIIDALTKFSTFLQAELGSQAFLDYELGCQFLRDLAQQEPVPGIDYVTFGGTSTHLFRFRIWIYTPESAIALPHMPPWDAFHWVSKPVGDTILSTTLTILGTSILTGLPQPLPPELTDGMGDLMVTDLGARLPFARHVSNPLNHAQALWDPAIHAQVIDILRQVKYPPPVEVPDSLPWLSLLLTD